MLRNKFIKNIPFVSILVIIYCIFLIPLPFYIEKDGGIISTKDRIKIENGIESSGNLYMSYVSEIKATIPNYIISLFNKNWDIINKDDVVSNNESEEEAEFRSKMLLNESITNSIIASYSLTGNKIDILKEDCYITYVDAKANTDLKIHDKILKINNIDITNKNDIANIVKEINKNDILTLEVENNGKFYTRRATLTDFDGTLAIGIIITTDRTLSTNPSYSINFKKSESGSSGGLMLALEIYNNLTKTDITKNRKIAGTGTIDENGIVGSIGGVKYKLIGAYNEGVDIFIVPNGENYDEAINVAKEEKINIKIIGVSTLKDAIEKLKEG